jgi:hypothetical protein
MRRPPTFRRRDIVAAMGAVLSTGEKVARVEIDRDGKIVVVIGEPATATGEDDFAQDIAALNERIAKSA